MTEQEAIKYLEQHAYIDDAVKDMCIKAMKKQISKEISVAPIKAHAEPTKMRTVIQTDKETTFDDVQEILNGTDLLAEHFRVNDVFYIPVKNQEEAIPFEVVHVAEDTRSIYLMSRDILTRKAMSEVADWLDNFGWSLPDDIFKLSKKSWYINWQRNLNNSSDGILLTVRKNRINGWLALFM